MNHNPELPAIKILPPSEEPLCEDRTSQLGINVDGGVFSQTYTTSELLCDANAYAGPSNLDSPSGQFPQLGLVIEGNGLRSTLPMHYSGDMSDTGLRAGATTEFLNVTDYQRLFDDHSGRGSPIDNWSPISTSSGDNLPDNYSDSSSLWSPAGSVGSASPSYPSSPTFDNAFLFEINDLNINEALVDDAASSSLRRSSVSSGSDRQDFYDGRPRAASFSGDFNFTREQMMPTSYHHSDNLQLNLDRDAITMSVAPPSPDIEPSWNNDSLFLNGLNTDLFLSTDNQVQFTTNRTRSSSVSSTHVSSPSTSQFHGTYLTVPDSNTLQRRNAHRRNQTHTGIEPPSPVLSGMGRGRSLRPANNHMRHHSLPSRPSSPQVQTDLSLYPPSPTVSSPSSPYSSSSEYGGYYDGSPSGSSSYSPSHSLSEIPDINIFDANSQPLARRQPSPFGADRALGRSASDPYPTTSTAKARRSPRTRRQPNGSDGMNVFKHDPLPSLDVEASDNGEEFKTVVASEKIVAAAEKRRLNPARFECDKCGARFTARHNLTNHMNSHANRKNFKCEHCGQRSVTQAVLTRHQLKSCKQRPNGKKGSLT